MPTRLIDDADRWLKTAKLKLDNFSKNSENPHFIAFEMLENKRYKMGGEDFMDTGEVILGQLAGQKDVSVQKVESMISELNVEFSPDALKQINEICRCNVLEGVSAEPMEDEEKMKASSVSANPKYAPALEIKPAKVPATASKAGRKQSSNLFDDDINDLLSDDLLTMPASSMEPAKKTSFIEP